MDKVNLEDSLKAAFVELQEYLDLQLKYNKLLLAKKMGDIFSYLALFVLVIGISGFLLIFLSFAFVTWYNQVTGSLYGGHLIVSAAYLTLALIIIIFRKGLIFNPLRKLFGQVMFGDDVEAKVYEEVFKSNNNLNQRIYKLKKAIKKKGEKIGSHYEGLSQQFTFANVVQSIVKNAYSSFVTTSNIAQAVYSLVKRITKRKKKKSRDKRKHQRPEIEEGID